jgi:hypothetical protein
VKVNISSKIMAEQIFVKRISFEVGAESLRSAKSSEVRETPPIPQSSTFDSYSADEGGNKLKIRRSYSSASEENGDDEDDDGILDNLDGADQKTALPHSHTDCSLFPSWEEIASQVYYISTFAILGTVLRIYMGRFFGLDCELNASGQAIDDIFTPVSSLVCVTSDGKYQRGGSVFIDLPANILGS